MSEISIDDLQLVGQADATKQTGEALSKEELELNAEQKQVIEVMQTEGAHLETAMLDARARASGQLKQLHGKELVDAGLKQMGHGVWDTFKSQVKWAIGGGLVGAASGGLLGGLGVWLVGHNEEALQRYYDNLLTDPAFVARNTTWEEVQRAKENIHSVASAGVGHGVRAFGRYGGMLGSRVGALVGFETAGLRYNKNITAKNNLPPTKWYDWVVSNAGVMGLRLLTRGRDIGTAGQIGIFVVNEVFNPISVAGMRNVATGLWQMRKE